MLEDFQIGDSLSMPPASAFKVLSSEKLPQLRADKLDSGILLAEQQFLQTWSHLLSPSTERMEFISAWYRSLKLGFGTPVNEFFQTLKIEQVNSSPESSLAPIYQVSFSGRFPAMNQLRAGDRPVTVPPDFEYGDRVDGACGCCHSSMQAEFHATDPDKFPILLDRPAPTIHMIPNRFPWDIGGVLIEPFHHDDLKNRILAADQATTPGSESKTYGNLITEDYLNALFRSSGRYDLVVFQNHPLSGMSQPWHTHAHGIPAEFPKGQIIKSLAELADRPAQGVALATSPLNVTDVLLISSGDNATTAHYAAEVLRQLELDNQVYTFACYDGCVAIAPEHKSADNRPHDRGARVLLHWFRPEELTGDGLAVAHHYPRPGEFTWQPYLPERSQISVFRNYSIRKNS